MGTRKRKSLPVVESEEDGIALPTSVVEIHADETLDDFLKEASFSVNSNPIVLLSDYYQAVVDRVEEDKSVDPPVKLRAGFDWLVAVFPTKEKSLTDYFEITIARWNKERKQCVDSVRVQLDRHLTARVENAEYAAACMGLYPREHDYFASILTEELAEVSGWTVPENEEEALYDPEDAEVSETGTVATILEPLLYSERVNMGPRVRVTHWKFLLNQHGGL